MKIWDHKPVGAAATLLLVGTTTKEQKKKKYASLTTNYGIHLWVDTKLEAFKICSLKLLKYV